MPRLPLSKECLRRSSVLLALFSLLGCEHQTGGFPLAARAACEALEWCEPTLLPPELIDLILDPGSPSAATPAHLGETLDRVLPRMTHRPRSQLRVWGLGQHEGEVQLLGTSRSPEVAGRRKRAEAKRARGTWLTATRSELMELVVPTLAQVPSRRVSMAAAVAAVALRDTGEGLARQYILVFDGYDPSLGRVLCESIPNDDAWMENLPWRRWLTNSVLTGSWVHITYFDPTDLPACAWSLSSRQVLRSVLSRAYYEAGAQEVLSEGSVCHFTDEPFAFAHRNGFELWPGFPEPGSHP